MKGDTKLIDQLNELLTGELSSVDQYFVHSRMYENWGLTRLYQRIGHERDDELQHADTLIKRILFLEGTPDLSRRQLLNIGHSVPEMLRSDLNLEYQVTAHLKQVIAYAEGVRDYVTRDLLVAMLDDTERDHAHWLEQQLGLIDRLGLENYLQSQLS